jgi:hypothetical protein
MWGSGCDRWQRVGNLHYSTGEGLSAELAIIADGIVLGEFRSKPRDAGTAAAIDQEYSSANGSSNAVNVVEEI